MDERDQHSNEVYSKCVHRYMYHNADEEEERSLDVVAT